GIRDHDQVDEMATDLMSLRVLRYAEFSPKNMLTGLELTFGFQPKRPPETNWKFAERIALAAVAVHPAERVRLNILRGALVHDRIAYGDADKKPVPFNPVLMREE